MVRFWADAQLHISGVPAYYLWLSYIFQFTSYAVTSTF